MTTASHIFSGLKILDLSSVLAGPSVASFFAELGAEVIKVESHQGDVTRTWFAKGEDLESTSAYYQSVNHHKKVITLDLNKDRKELNPIIADSDIVIHNFKFGDDEKFQLTEKDIRSVQPNIIIAAIKGFENDHQRVAYDVVLQAETGFMSINGEKDSPPLKMPVAFMDVMAAHQLKEGVLCALYHRLKTGNGSNLHCSLEMAGIASLMNQGSIYLKSKIVPKANGSLHPTICPYGEILTFMDGEKIVLAIGSQRQFNDLCVLLGLSDLPLDIRFKDNISRVNHRKELILILQKASEQIALSTIYNLLLEHKVPFGKIKTIDEVISTAKEIGALEIDRETQTSFIKSVAFELKTL
jgi:crotonobetainyl-CoA:carnitine CoA-transferase CaiB-like acyl-CoA transferase